MPLPLLLAAESALPVSPYSVLSLVKGKVSLDQSFFAFWGL